jgi:SAM-dependent methyltransferase
MATPRQGEADRRSELPERRKSTDIAITDGEAETNTACESMTYKFYDMQAKEYYERTIEADLSDLYDRFLVSVPEGGKILDAGCGSGRDLRRFLERGFDAVGIDASKALVEMANKYSGMPCHVVRLEEIAYERRFDGIWACASLLHLPKHMLVPVLRRLCRALVSDGVMFASVQAGKGEVLTDDGRFFAYYEEMEFLTAVDNAGFTVAASWISEDTLPGREAMRWINVLAKSCKANEQ